MEVKESDHDHTMPNNKSALLNNKIAYSIIIEQTNEEDSIDIYSTPKIKNNISKSNSTNKLKSPNNFDINNNNISNNNSISSSLFVKKVKLNKFYIIN